MRNCCIANRPYGRFVDFFDFSGVSKKPERLFRQPGHEASDEEAQDTAEPRAPTDDDERVRECVDERRRWGA